MIPQKYSVTPLDRMNYLLGLYSATNQRYLTILEQRINQFKEIKAVPGEQSLLGVLLRVPVLDVQVCTEAGNNCHDDHAYQKPHDLHHVLHIEEVAR
ncbi:hypothetical protein [Shimazuella alba]|uniref:Uncharacterized protein n=1 Tax=Shimazuella alba TaxID=2690964 RepID=A0A6I4VWP5_9BACL|nr:hypothetical protein [Shimazuella alba]MXQ55041.1 hypothetical protein [Shimazuella alba]